MTKIPDLWPEGIIAQPEISPVAILKTQAAYLGEKTKNLVEGQVVSRVLDDKFVHSFYLVVPTLDNYRYLLFQVVHSGAPYPLEIKISNSRYDLFGNEESKIDDEYEFLATLRQILSSRETIQTINSLLSTVSAVEK